MTKQRQVMADSGLALAKLLAQCANMLFGFLKDQNDLEPGRIADVLQQGRGAPSVVDSVVRFLRGLWLGDPGRSLGRLRGLGGFDDLGDLRLLGGRLGWRHRPDS